VGVWILFFYALTEVSFGNRQQKRIVVRYGCASRSFYSFSPCFITLVYQSLVSIGGFHPSRPDCC